MVRENVRVCARVCVFLCTCVCVCVCVCACVCVCVAVQNVSDAAACRVYTCRWVGQCYVASQERAVSMVLLTAAQL